MSCITVDPADHDSDGLEISPGEAMTLPHNVGGNPEDRVVSLWCDDQDTLYSVHNYRTA